MKIISIIGSPRKKGNTYKVVERVREELISKDSSIEFENIFLADCNIKMCKGCFRCFAKGRDKCPLDDDLYDIYNKMMQADGVILAAPAYAMGPPALMKNLIDRLSYTLHRPCFFDQSFLLVSTVGGVMGLKQTLGQLSLLSAGSKKSLMLGVPMPPFSIPILQNSVPRKLIKAASRFYASMNKQGRHRPGFGDFAFFSAFKAMSEVESYKTECPADFEYYDKREAYFYPVSRVRTLLGKSIAGFMKGFIGLIVRDAKK